MLSSIKSLLPKGIKAFLKAKLVGDNWLESTYFSQFGEDVILRSYFPKNKKSGFFVDIGAYQPVSLSNTYYFYLKGWRGINIEPNPIGIKAFKEIRPDDKNLQIGIADKPGVLHYHMIPNKPFENTFSDLQLNIRHAAENRGTSIELPVDTLGNILDKNLPKGQEIDFFSIDVEGLNVEVILSNNWEKYRPKIIVIEKHNQKEEHKNQQITSFLTAVGYKLDHDILHSYFFSRND
jgi:FkbM family methyltransferase